MFEAKGVTVLLRFTGSVERDAAVAAWLAGLADEVGALARRWFARIRGCGPDVRELMHDGFATVCVQDAPFAYVGAFKAHANLGFFQGASLPDPAGRLEGSGKSMRHVTLRPGQPLDAAALDALVLAAYRDILAKLVAGG